MWFYITHDGCPMIGEAQIETKVDTIENYDKYTEKYSHFFSIGGCCEWEEIGEMSVAEVYELNLLFVRLYGYVIDDLLCQHERRGTLTTSRRKYKHEADFACHKREV